VTATLVSSRARLPRVLFWLGEVSTASRISIVSFKETANPASLIQLALQFSYVETRLLMLAETCTLGISFHFRLESLCRKTRPSCARVLWMGLNSMISAVPNHSSGSRLVGSHSDSVLWGFFRLATLNLRVDSCMFEIRFPMLAERLALGITLPVFLERLYVKSCFSLFFWVSA
jgi:hypothetical protein